MGQFTDLDPADEAGFLGNYGNNCAIPGQGPEIWLGFAEPLGVPGASRRAALALRERLWSVSSIADVRKCGKVPRGTSLDLVDAPGGIRLTGLCTCHSVWVCPICAPEIRGARGAQIAEALSVRLGDGGGASFGTATLSHVKAHALRGTYSLVVSCWHSVSVDRSVREFRKDNGWWGFIRTTEVTHGDNGWHPHVHWLDLWQASLSWVELKEYGALVYSAWSRAVRRLSDRKASAERGVLVLPVVAGEVEAIANYVTELSAQSASFELTAVSTKEAKKTGKTPFQILARVYGPGSKPWVDLWWEYEQATRGRRMLGSSRGLLDRLGLSVDDPEPVVRGEVVARVRAEDWSAIRWFTDSGLAGVQAILEEAAKGGQVAVNAAVQLLLGVPVALGPDSQAVAFDFDRPEDSF